MDPGRLTAFKLLWASPTGRIRGYGCPGGVSMSRWLHQINRLVRAAINRNGGSSGDPDWHLTLGISALLHAALLGILALVVVAQPRSSEVIEILTEWDDARVAPSIPIEAPLLAAAASASPA